jgi:hypothetical protein
MGGARRSILASTVLTEFHSRGLVRSASMHGDRSLRVFLRRSKRPSVRWVSSTWIQLETTPQPFGGRRWWFVCPRTGRRVAKLYLPSGAFTFASRQAYRLAYRSQRETPYDRALRRGFKLRGKLGADGGMGDYVPSRSGCAGRPTIGSSRKSSPPRRSSTPIYWGSSKNSSAVQDDEIHLVPRLEALQEALRKRFKRYSLPSLRRRLHGRSGFTKLSLTVSARPRGSSAALQGF